MGTESTWTADIKPKITHPQLESDTTADVLIVGGGLTGLLTAYLLSRKKLNVVLIEKDSILGTATNLRR